MRNAKLGHHLKAVSGVCSAFGAQNLNPQQEKAVAEFLSGSDVFVNLPMAEM